MALAIWRLHRKTKNNFIPFTNTSISPACLLSSHFSRSFSDDKFSNNPQFCSTTILIEHGYNVQELPVIVRKLKDLSEIENKPPTESTQSAYDSYNYNLIQEEFKQCVDLREVFSLLSKCTKITPNIALGAMERIYDLEKDPESMNIDSKSIHINLAKGAILDKLLRVVMKTEDTQTILNILNTVSTFMEPYKHKFSNELLFRVIDNKLSVEQLCEFITFLIKNKTDPKYCETIDKLWVGFVEREAEIIETNIAKVFSILKSLKSSKKTVLSLLEQKLTNLWSKIDVSIMQEILDTFFQEKYVSIQSFAVIGRWLHTNIHVLDEESLLDIISKLTRLKYTDDQVEKAVEKYMKLKGCKIEMHVLIVGILNYAMQFQICNKHILNVSCEYFLRNGDITPPNFLTFIIYPYGFFNFDPVHTEFWAQAENIVDEKFYKMTADDLCSIILSFIYAGKYPLNLVKKIFSPEYIIKVNNPATLKRLHLIDTALSLECPDFDGPLLPKHQCLTPVSQDRRIRNIINKIMDSLVHVAGGTDKISTAVLIPHFCSDDTYLLDIMIHPAGLGSNNLAWKPKLSKNSNIAILIHLPDHFCSDNEHLVGPQLMRKKHLKILGMKVVSIKYSLLSQLYTSHNTNGLIQYLLDSINNAEPCL